MIHIATISTVLLAVLVNYNLSLLPPLPVHVPAKVVYLFIALLVLRWPITPWVLHALSKGTTWVESVSFRSIKGIRFEIPGLLRVECDRLGYTVHLFGRKANRRIGVTFDGLRLTVLRIPSKKAEPQRNGSLTPEPLPLPHETHELSHKKASPLLEWLKSILPEHWVLYLDDASRALLRSFFSLFVDFCLQVAPQLISTLSIRFKSVHVTFVELGGLNFTFSDAELAVTVSLQVIAKHQMTEQERRELRAEQRSKAKTWKDRFAGTVSRTVMASWKGRQGAGSLTLKLNNFTIFNPSPPPMKRQRAQSSVSVDSGGWTQFVDIDVHAPEHAVVHISGETELGVKCEFDPRKGKVAYHSAKIHSRVPDVTVFVDVLQALINDIQFMIPKSPTTPADTNGFPASPFPETPMTAPMYSAPTSPLLSPPLMSPASSISSPRPRKDKLKDRKLMQYFNSAGVQVGRFTVQYTSTKSKEPIQYKSQIIGLDFGLKLSDPDNDVLHRKWLGKGGKPTLETCKAWFCFTDVIVHRDHDLSTDDGHIRIVKTAGLKAEVLLHQFPPPLLQRKEDATEPFIACEIDMDSIEATENLNLIRKRLARPPAPKPTRNEQIQQLQRLQNIPRLAVDIRVGDMKGRLICDDEKVFDQDVGLDVQFESAELHIRSDYDQFKDPQKLGKARGTRTSDCFPSYNFIIDAAIHSPSVRTTYATADEDYPSAARPKLGAPSHGGFSRLEDPVFLVEGFEFHTTGNLMGRWTGNGEDIILNRESLMADVNLIIDVLHIELWTLSSLEALQYFLHQLNAARAKSKQRGPTPTLPPPETDVMNALPSGIQVHAAIASLTIGATGKDLNPECNLDLYRGLLLRTSLMFRYCSVVTARHNSRARGRFKLAISREKLRLPEDLFMQAFSFAAQYDEPKAVSALTEVTLSGTVLRRVVGNQFGVDESALNAPVAPVGHDSITLSIPRIRTRVTLTRKCPPGKETDDKLQIHVDVKVINGHLQLLDAYCGLLALQTAKHLFGVRLKPKSKAPMTPGSNKPNKMQVLVTVDISSAQFICQLPLAQVLHVRWNILHFKLSDPKSIELKWSSMSVLVPSGLYLHRAHDRRWEELIRLPVWDITVVPDPTTGEPSIQVVGQFARVRIPNGFVPADTILSVTLAIKAVKHLAAITPIGVYSQMPTPPNEEAKHVPNISVTIAGLLFEATDSPIEARLNLAFRQNMIAQRTRLEYQDAFDAKVAKIEASSGKPGTLRRTDGWNLTDDHSVGINVARQSLRQLLSSLWTHQVQDARATAMAREESITMRFREHKYLEHEGAIPVSLYVPPSYPPLFRLTLNGVSASIRSPKWSGEQLAAFMEGLGQGVPRDTQFTLLVPLHIDLALSSARLVLRDLPLPILNVPPSADKSLTFVTDLVIGEETGPASSVRWVNCDVASEDADALGTAAFNVLIPKTTMPVKTYAQPEIKVSTSGITDMCFGVSFLPIMQEVMKVIDGLSTLPADPSPSLGFWDKLRLIMHWRTDVRFTGEVHVHLKGSRNAWKTTGGAVGIALCAKRNTRITVGHPNPENELIQFSSDDMLIVVPSLKHFENAPSGLSNLEYDSAGVSRQPQKVVAKLVNGVRIGSSFTFERACTSDCEKCPPEADAFHRSCRIFDFKPHYEVALRADSKDKGPDSFLGFRSDFIHCGFSMHSPITPDSSGKAPNSIHLTPRIFAHFWSVVKLFDNALALPIRQGPMWPGARPPSEKFGRHLATMKLRLCLDNMAISHTYKQDSQDSWANGEVPSVGVKALVKTLRADLHQRDQEIRSQIDGSKAFKYTKEKALYGAEVTMSDIYMRAIVSIFREPDLQAVVSDPHRNFESPYGVAPPASINDDAFDMDDYTELDWLPTDQSPKFYMGEVASCPEFSFVKKIEQVRQPSDDSSTGAAKMSKFGSEHSHECLMGRELDPRLVQLSMATKRKKDLEAELERLEPSSALYRTRQASLLQRIALLSTNIEKLVNPPPSATPSRLDGQLHGNWTESDWDAFDNRYYVHAPKLSLSNGTRNILLQYYYESRRRRGFEYHMAASAVRFIREHAVASEERKEEPKAEPEKPGPALQITRNKSANAVKRLFVRQPESRRQLDVIAGPADVDHSIGTYEQTDTRRSHFCLLFKPQIVLRSNLDDESVIIISANDAAIQMSDVMDKKIDDPVNGHMLSKIHFILSGMQIFSPSSLYSNPSGSVQLPFEVFLDDSCETSEYDRIVLHTSCVVQYDKYNRLRLRTASQSTPQSDMLLANVRSFTLQANSDHFTSLYNVVTDLLLYSDPSNRTRLDRLEAFILNDDISDFATTATEIATRQGRIRVLSEKLNDYTLREGDLRDTDRMEMNEVAADIMNQTEELSLIFDAVQTVQDRDELASQSKVGIRLEATSPELIWNLMDRDGSLLARLALRSIDFLWISSQDGSSANRLKIKDLEALDARPNAKFPEMISKQKKWLQENPMAKSNTLLEVVWNTAAPVGGISILTNFDLSFHPINVQFDASVGHKIQTYIFPKDRSLRYHSSSPDSADGDSDNRSPDSDGPTDVDLMVPSRKSLDERGGRPMLKAPKVSLSRSSSHSDLGRASNNEDGLRLRRVPSHQGLRSTGKQPASNGAVTKHKSNDGVAEMRARSAENRTFVSARINASGLCLSFRRDKDLSALIPDINDLRFETPEIVFGNRTCSFRDILQEFKWELISKTGNVLLSSNGLRSFNFSGIKDRLLPGKRTHTRLEPPKPIHRQIGNVMDTHASSSSGTSSITSSSIASDSSSTLAKSESDHGRTSMSNGTHRSRRMGSIDSGSGRKSLDHGEESDTNTPRRKLMSLLHRTGSPRHSPSLKPTSLAPPSNL